MARHATEKEIILLGNRKNNKYPWHLWADGAARVLTQGEDFTATVNNMRVSAASYAKTHGMTVLLYTLSQDSLLVQFKDGEPA